jgi:hypothetical protein
MSYSHWQWLAEVALHFKVQFKQTTKFAFSLCLYAQQSCGLAGPRTKLMQ